MAIDKETQIAVLSILTKNEELLRELVEQQKIQSDIIDSLIMDYEPLKIDVKKIKEGL